MLLAKLGFDEGCVLQGLIVRYIAECFKRTMTECSQPVQSPSEKQGEGREWYENGDEENESSNEAPLIGEN